MYTKDVFTYERFVPQIELQEPDLKRINQVYESLDFTRKHQPLSVLLRGSTAALLPRYGEITLRTPSSDLDFVAVTNDRKPDYSPQIMAVGTVSGCFTVKTDVLAFNPTAFIREQQSLTGTFLQTKLLHPTWFLHGNVLRELKVSAFANLLIMSATREKIRAVTPSGASALVLEENLYVEPWRRLSLRSYFQQSPLAARNIAQLTQFSKFGLDLLEQSNLAEKLSRTEGEETVYSLNIPTKSQIRSIYVLSFLFSQLSYSVNSRTGLKGERVRHFIHSAVAKIRSLSTNPTLDYKITNVFD